MWPHSARVDAALDGPHRIHTRLEWSPDWFHWYELPAADVSVVQDRTAVSRWTLKATLPTGCVPLGRDGLHEFGCRMRVSLGVQGLRMDTEWLPYGVYRVDDIGRDEPASTFPVAGQSLEQAVADAEFPRPRVLPDTATDTKRSQLERLVREAVPDAVIEWDQRLAWFERMPTVTEDKDRAALTVDGGELSIPASIGGELSTDAGGTFRVRQTPTLADAAVWTLRRGDGGHISTIKARPAARIRNLWIVTGQLADSRTVVGPAFAWDNDPTSLTYAGPDPVVHPHLAGRYGVRPGYYTSPLIETLGSAKNAADAQLANALGSRAGLSVTGRFHPAWEAGDVVLVEETEGQFRPHLIDTIAWSSGQALADIATRIIGPQTGGTA